MFQRRQPAPTTTPAGRGAAVDPPPMNNKSTATNHTSHATRDSANDNKDVEDVLSPAFFQRYDALFQASSSIESARQAFQQAVKRRDEVKNHLAELEKKLQLNRNSAKEQLDRIAMVEQHWFYGTTALQPQLWLRGGCPGKIDRARAKLETAEKEYPALQQRVAHVQNIQLPPLVQQVVTCQNHVMTCSTAVALRTSMKERALSEYPSVALLDFKDQITRVPQERAVFQGQVQQLTRASQLYQQAQSQYYQPAQATLQSAMEHANRYQQLQVEAVQPLYDTTPPLTYPAHPHQYWRKTPSIHISTTGTGTSGSAKTMVTLENTYRSRHNRISTKVELTYEHNKGGRLVGTNIPCPNHCGFLISPWHGTHCCGACQRGGGGQRHHHHHHHRGAGHRSHGRRCQRLPVSTQDGSQALVTAWNHRLQEHEEEKERQWKGSQDKLQQGQNQVKEGNALIDDGKVMLLVPRAVQATYPAVTQTLQMGSYQRSGSAHSVTLSMLAKNRTDDHNAGRLLLQSIGMVTATLEQCQSLAQSEESLLQHVKTQIQTQEIKGLDRKLEGIWINVRQEEDRVWNELRERALMRMPAPAAAEPPRPPSTTTTTTTPQPGTSCACSSSSSTMASAAAMAPVIPIVTHSSSTPVVPSAPPEDYPPWSG